MSPVDALFFGAHPDDVELTSGGLLARLAQHGHATAIVDLTRGEAASRGSVDERRAEAEQAARDLGAGDRENLALPDLGLDRVYVYSIDAATGKLLANDPPFVQVERGRGPRHIAFHPNGRLAYVINELNSTMTGFTWDSANGVLTEIETLTTLPDGWTGRKWSAQVKVHPNGRFVYGSNRGSGGDSDDIAIFRIDESTGRMTPAGHAQSLGKVPRNFTIDPSGRFLVCAHQESPMVAVFSIDQQTGALTPTGSTLEIANAICIQFAPGVA